MVRRARIDLGELVHIHRLPIHRKLVKQVRKVLFSIIATQTAIRQLRGDLGVYTPNGGVASRDARKPDITQRCTRCHRTLPKHGLLSQTTCNSFDIVLVCNTTGG